MGTDKLKQGIANLVFGPGKVGFSAQDAMIQNKETRDDTSILDFTPVNFKQTWPNK